MAGGSPSTSSSSLSSLASYGGMSDDIVGVRGIVGGASAVKFVCSYGGKILPRYPDGKLRYVGGDTRVLAVDRAISFSELSAKMVDLCGWGIPVSLRCQHPSEDLDALVSITSDEDLANLLEEYDVAGRSKDSQHKIKAFLSPKRPLASASSASKGKSPYISTNSRPIQNPSFVSPFYPRLPVRPPTAVCYGQRLNYPQDLANRGYTVYGGPSASSSYRYQHQQKHPHLIHLGKHWQ